MTSPAANPVEPDPKGVPDPGLPIAEVAQRAGLSKDTLRYYERAGLIEAVDRSLAGQRRYATTDLDWLERAWMADLVGPSFGPFDEFHGPDEGDGEGDLSESLFAEPVGVAAQLTKV